MWNSKPMFTREHPDSMVDYEIDMKSQMQDTISAMKLTRENAEGVLEVC